MNPRHLSKLIAVILALSLPEALLAQRPHGPARFAELQNVHVTDSFWKPLLDRNRAVTIPHNLRMCCEVGIVANFERVAGLRDGDYFGLPNWDENGFARLTRDWRSGDVIELDLPMPVRRAIAHPKVEDCAGKVALERGPIVYCFEGADHDGRVLDLALPADAAFQPRLRPDVLGGTTVLEGVLVRGQERIQATAIPYHLWSNRGPGEMTMWLITIGTN